MQWLRSNSLSFSTRAMKNLEQVLEETEVNDTTVVCESRFVTLLHKPDGLYKGLDIYASDEEAKANKAFSNSRVRVQLPRELDVGSNNTIVFCMLTWPEANVTELGAEGVLYESRLVGLSVRGKNVSGLLDPVTITMHLSANETQTPRCVFLNFSSKRISSDGCLTQWAGGPGNLTCCCDHLTYFGVLLVSSSTVSHQDQEILTYITTIGCSLSLVALVITVVLFVTNRKVRADVSMKVHINLVIALILLNLHFLPSQWVAAWSSTGLCLYAALSLHYSLLATFSWMALEGFHLYLLLVRVFNIYIRRYLLKLSLVGWGVPALIVSLVVTIDKGWYGRVALDNSTSEICYIVNPTVKMVTSLGVFGLVFVFNMIMLVVTVRRILGLCQSKEFGQRERHKAKRGVCTLLGVTTLLGITWGLVFFSFGYLTTPGLYLFCILNPLQGFFIFLWFVLSLRKSGNSATTISSVTHNTNS
uniref:adhesion G-protein coupled receptor G1-like isoform X2 n=1 Tax=Gasterosteus aculeatus aculeatus TaxID=481459 RepID=UPI001A97F093|nr:adhesion G-protein coupled receptor G1-like isoform X2 [Gasterosteus aculeatus aculeatus]